MGLKIKRKKENKASLSTGESPRRVVTANANADTDRDLVLIAIESAHVEFYKIKQKICARLDLRTEEVTTALKFLNWGQTVSKKLASSPNAMAVQELEVAVTTGWRG